LSGLHPIAADKTHEIIVDSTDIRLDFDFIRRLLVRPGTPTS
jgi:hypothetical protein